MQKAKPLKKIKVRNTKMKKQTHKLAIRNFILGAMLIATMAFADNDKGGFGDHDGGLKSIYTQPAEPDRNMPPEAWALAHPYADGNGHSDYGRSHHNDSNGYGTSDADSICRSDYSIACEGTFSD